MAVPPSNRTDVTMLEIAVANSSPTGTSDGDFLGVGIDRNQRNGSGTNQRLFFTSNHGNSSNGESSVENPLNGHSNSSTITITMSQSGNIPRPSRESVLQRLSEALLRRSLAKLDLSQRGLQPSDARLVKMALSQNSSLSVLKLGYNNLCDDGVMTLASGIAIHKSLVLLDLGFNNFGDDGAKALATALREASRRNRGGSVRTLYLAGNLIGEDGAIAIADFIRQGSKLRKLYMTGNRIGADGVKAITEGILEDEIRQAGGDAGDLSNGDYGLDSENPANDENGSFFQPPASPSKRNPASSFQGMQELFLGGTGMGTQGCQAVSRLLMKSACLQLISLPNCDIGDEEVRMLASSIKSNKGRLPVESIQLSFNNMSHKGLESLTNAVWGSTTLRELKLDNNEIGDRGAHQVAAILPALKGLENLDVGFNSIKASGLNVLMKAVAESEFLKSLSVSGNAIDVPSAKAVAYALAYNRSLQSLSLVHCSINHEGHRHIAAGAVSNNRIALRQLTGFSLGPVIVTLGFPEALKNWTNEQVLNFINLMWEQNNDEEPPESNLELELDPLNFLPSPSGEKIAPAHRPLEASVVVEVAKKAYDNLVANGVDIFTKKSRGRLDPSFGSPLAGDAIMIESTEASLAQSDPFNSHQGESKVESNNLQEMPSKMARSFVAPPESNSCTKKQETIPDPARKQKIVEWLCSNIQHLNELSQLPFNSRELWRLHQHYFTPVVNESGGAVYAAPGNRIVSSVPEVSRGTPVGSAVTPSTQSSDDHLLVPASDPVLQASPAAPASLPMLKRKVSYRFLGDAMITSQLTRSEQPRFENSFQNGSVARMIEEGHTGHSLPPKTKRARRNRTRISFLPKIKEKLDSYLDVCHEKALTTMRQLYFVEQAILNGQVNPLEPSQPNRTHLSGTLASEAEMIVVDMI